MHKKFLRTFACVLMVATTSPSNLWGMQEETMSDVGAWFRNARQGKYSNRKNLQVINSEFGIEVGWDSMAEAVQDRLENPHNQIQSKNDREFCLYTLCMIGDLSLDPEDEWRLERALPHISVRNIERLNKERIELATKKINEDIMKMCQQILIGKRNVKRLHFTVETGEYEYKATKTNSSSSFDTSNSSYGSGGGGLSVFGLFKIGGSGGGGSSSNYSYSNTDSANEIYMKLRPTSLKSLEIEFFEDK